MTNRTDGLAEEVAYWDQELALRGVHAEYVRRRLDPEQRRQEYPIWIDGIVAARIADTGRQPLKAIDLGSGPLTTLAWGHDEGQLAVDALDPLASEYGRLMKLHSVAYPVIPRPGHGEILADVVGSGVADLIYSRNALDHAENVQTCFEQVADALSPGGVFALEVFAYEGRRESYSGLHQFDFRCEDGVLRCSNRSGDDALDLAGTGLVPIFVSPPRTLRIPDAGDPPEGIFAVFAKDVDEQGARAFRARIRNRQLLAYWREALAPQGAMGQYWTGSWDAELMRHVFPGWIEPLAVEHAGAGSGEPLRALELMSGPVPSLLWAQLAGHAKVTAVDAIADDLQALERELGIEPPPVDWIQSEPEELAQALGDRRFDLVFTRHTLHKVEDLQAVLVGVGAVLDPGGIFCLEAVAGEGERAAWNFPVRFSFSVANGRLEARDHLDRPALDLERAGLELVSITPAQPSSKTGDLLHVCLRRKR